MSEIDTQSDALTPINNGQGKDNLFFESSENGVYKTFMKRKFSKFRKASFELVMETANYEFSKLMQPGLIEVIEKAQKDLHCHSLPKPFLSHISSDKKTMVQFNRFDVKYTMELLEKFTVTSPLHAFFAGAITTFFSWRRSEALSNEDAIRIVDNHVKVFHNTTIDSEWKLAAILNPFSSQLGLEHSRYISDALVNQSDVNILSEDAAYLALYEKLLICSGKTSIFSKRTLVKNIDPMKRLDLGLVSLNFYFFKNQPIGNPVFQNKVNSMTAEEVNYNCWMTPFGFSDEIMVDYIDKRIHDFHMLKVIEKKFSSSAWKNIPNIKNMIKRVKKEETFDYFGSPILSLHSLCRHSGHRKFFECYFGAHPEIGLDEVGVVVSNIRKLKSAAALHIVHFDYVLLKLMECLTVDEVLELMNEARNNDFEFSLLEWIAISQHYDFLQDAPMSWWSSLLKI